MSAGILKQAASSIGSVWNRRMRSRLSFPQHPHLDRVVASPLGRLLWNIREVFLIGGVYLLYMFARKVILSDVVPGATENALKVVAFEQKLSFLWEPAWQKWAIEHAQWLVVTMNWAYIFTFFPIIGITAVIFYFRDRPRYVYYRNIILTSYIVALLIFIFFPLAPPRMLGLEFGFVDAIAEFGPTNYGGREMAFFYNAYAAMPSLHFGWTLLFGTLFWNTRGPWWVSPWLKLLGVAYPTVTFFAITITGNHYIVDAIGGGGVALISILVYHALLRWSRRRQAISRFLEPPVGSRPTAA